MPAYGPPTIYSKLLLWGTNVIAPIGNICPEGKVWIVRSIAMRSSASLPQQWLCYEQDPDGNQYGILILTTLGASSDTANLQCNHVVNPFWSINCASFAGTEGCDILVSGIELTAPA